MRSIWIQRLPLVTCRVTRSVDERIAAERRSRVDARIAGRSGRLVARLVGSGSPRRSDPDQQPRIRAGGRVGARAREWDGAVQQRLVDVELVSFGVGQRDPRSGSRLSSTVVCSRVAPRDTSRAASASTRSRLVLSDARGLRWRSRRCGCGS